MKLILEEYHSLTRLTIKGGIHTALCWLVCVLLSSFAVPNAHAQSTICAVVKIEIQQELTLERQAFEASLVIENTLADKTLENIGVVVNFTDDNDEPVVASSNPNDSNADFFIRVNGLDGIDSVTGNGVLAGGQTAVANWLIIPTPGASGGIPSGKLYFVGADFNYTLDGVDETITVAPDSIYVKPMPLLTLDYFLPRDVFADDPLTQSQIEPIEPFTLGVRVQNNGSGTAQQLKIESAQPEIVENDQGLLIDFRLLDSYVQDQPIENTLLLNFGDIPSNESKMGRWNMSTTLSGRFTEFTADFTHADELGGELTSLLEEVNTHTLVRDVLVDEPGRDTVRDFLADDIDEFRVYESNSTTSVVNNVSDVAQFSGIGNNRYRFSFGPVLGFAYAELPDPFNGSKEVRRVVRSDGKEISLNNVWFAKRYNRTTRQISFHINLFDSNTSGNYVVELGDPVRVPLPPLIQFISLKTTYEGNQLGFLVESSDPDGTVPIITVENAPAGTDFRDRGNGTAQFVWTPEIGQAGRYVVRIVASDGELSTSRDVVIVVNSVLDTDGDGLLDSWEIEQFGNLDRDGTGDADGDGISDLDEFKDGSDPNVPNGPLAPELVSPEFNGTVITESPLLVISNSVYSGDQPIVYEFEVSENQDFSLPVDAFYAQPQGESGQTEWQVSALLNEDQTYYWRVRANDGFSFSPWLESQFLVNIENRLPPAPTIVSPAQGSQVSIVRPVFRVGNSVDPDGDQLSYEFFVYSDAAAANLVAQSDVLLGTGNTTQWQISTPLNNQQMYYWRASVTDSRNLPIATDLVAFTTNISTPTPLPPKPPRAPGDVIMAPVINLLLEEEPESEPEPADN